MPASARTLPILVLLPILAADATAGQQQAPEAEQMARETLARFEAADPSWQGYMQAVVELVKAGPGAIPVLVETLKTGPTQSRLLAGEVLKLVVEPGAVDGATRSALENALEDPEDSVREFAIHALSRIGGLESAKEARHVLENDPNLGIRRVMAAALRGELRTRPPAIRESLAAFDPAVMDSARLGQVAPDFSLADTTGKDFRLSQLRDKRTVVLVFLVEDD